MLSGYTARLVQPDPLAAGAVCDAAAGAGAPAEFAADGAAEADDAGPGTPRAGRAGLAGPLTSLTGPPAGAALAVADANCAAWPDSVTVAGESPVLVSVRFVVARWPRVTAADTAAGTVRSPAASEAVAAVTAPSVTATVWEAGWYPPLEKLTC